MSDGLENNLSELWALKRSKRKTILDAAWQEAFRKESKVKVLLKWYTFHCIGLVIVSFCLEFGAGFALPGTDFVAIMVPFVLFLYWVVLYEKVQVYFLRSYLLKLLSVNKI